MNQFFREYLDTPVNRYGTKCEKWDNMERVFGGKELIAAWVADMDFRTVPEVQKALIERAEHAIYGYTDNDKDQKAAEVGWLKRRHGFEAQSEWILSSAGVIDSLYFCVRALTDGEDKILIQTPVYGPFYSAIRTFGRTMVKSPLLETEDGWKMNLEDLERQFSQGVRMMILCSPHNPVGRVWTKDELEKVLELANRYGVIIVSDEIHADFTFDGHKQTRILSLENSDNCVMLTSATKSFNLAGLRQSSCIIKNAELREKVRTEMLRAHATSPNLFGSIAQTAAYTYGDEWMDAVLEYIGENRRLVADYIRENIPEIKVRSQEGTYLMWLDCRGLSMTHEEIAALFVKEAHVALNSGYDFGEEGDRRFRLNLATPRCNVEKILENMKNAIRSR